MGSGTLVSFQDDIAFSYSQPDFWLAVYKQAFPGLVGVTNIQQDCAAQRAGCDAVLTLSNGQTVKVDEKLQRRETNTLYLEYEVGKGKAGWMEKDLAVDYIAYGMLPSRTAYMLPYPQLRGAWAKYGEEWKQLYTRQTPGSKGACPPVSHVLAAIAETLEVVA